MKRQVQRKARSPVAYREGSWCGGRPDGKTLASREGVTSAVERTESNIGVGVCSVVFVSQCAGAVCLCESRCCCQCSLYPWGNLLLLRCL